MPATVLVELDDLKDFLGIAEDDESADDVLAALLAEVQAALETDAGRRLIPFAAGAALTDRLDGTGTREIFARYPLATLTSVVLGLDPTDPVETLDATDPLVISFAVGERRIVRVDGGVFGCHHAPRYVKLVGTSQDDFPATAGLAVKRAIAALYGQRGSEDATHEALADYTRDLAKVTADDPLWQKAVEASGRRVVA